MDSFNGTDINIITYIMHFNNAISILEFILSQQQKGVYLLQHRSTFFEEFVPDYSRIYRADTRGDLYKTDNMTRNGLLCFALRSNYLYKADTFFAPMVCALQRFHCTISRWKQNFSVQPNQQVSGVIAWRFSLKKVLLEISQNSQENICARVSLRPATLLKRRLKHRCFPVNFAKFRKTLFLTEHLWWLLLKSKQSLF